jgi:hypothetical protein
MIVEQIYTGCLSQGAYYIESNGEAAVIDPLREVAPYMDRAKKTMPKSNIFLKLIFMLILSVDTSLSPIRLRHPLSLAHSPIQILM